MKLSTAFAYLALTCASVDATKPMMHAGRLSLQDFLALRNGVFLFTVNAGEYHICGRCHGWQHLT